MSMTLLGSVLLMNAVSSGASFAGSPPFPPGEMLDIAENPTDTTIALFQQQVLHWYLYHGYPFASIGCYLAGPDSLVCSTVPGRHASLEAIRFEGLETTRPETLERLFRGGDDPAYDPAAVEKWHERLDRLPFLDWVGGHTLMLGPGGNLVVVQPVAEGPMGSFSASMGVSGQGGEDDFEGEGVLDVTNLLGTGREISVTIERSPWGGTNAGARYLEPWIAGQPLSIELEAMQEVPDSGYLNREAEICTIWEVDSRLEIRTGAGRWWGFQPSVDRTYGYGLAGIGFVPGHRTRKGWEGLQIALEGRLGTATGPDSAGTLAQAELVSRIDFFTGLLGYGGDILGGGVLEGEPLYSRLTRLGGQETLRGWPENSFRAVKYIIVRPEVSLGETDTRIYAFCDLGVLEAAGGIRRPAGAGAGLRGTAGSFRIDAAVGIPLRGGPARFYLSAAAEIL